MSNIEVLYKSLNQRERPEDIAELVLSVLKNQLSPTEIGDLRKVNNQPGVVWYRRWPATKEFEWAISLKKQITEAIEIFDLKKAGPIDYISVPDIKSFIKSISPLIHKQLGKNDFRRDRLTKSDRKDLHFSTSKRQYNKKWRLIKKLEYRLTTFQRVLTLVELQKIAKHGIVHQLDFKNFKSDLNAACFIAFYCAKSNLKSKYTTELGEEGYGHISELLLKRCLKSTKEGQVGNETNWLALSHIYSSEEVLTNLTDEQKGDLLCNWTNILDELANILEKYWNNNLLIKETMIEKKGMDSIKWNSAADAWNNARDHWVNLIYSLGLDYVLDEILFGKVIRLTWPHVVVGPTASLRKQIPHKEVWNMLPLPWEVFKGKEKCNKEVVIKCCELVEIDAEKYGWVTLGFHEVTEYKPTPELVQGIAVSNPFLATILKKHKGYP